MDETENGTTPEQFDSILTEAYSVTRKARQVDYAHPAINFIRVADFWTSYLRGIGKLQGNTALTAQDIARMMELFKVARQMQSYKHDTVVDTAGYADCDARIHDFYKQFDITSDEVAEMNAQQISELHELIIRQHLGLD